MPGEVRWCRSCGAMIWRSDSKPHRCPPLWECALAESADDEDEYGKAHGRDPKDAAERFAREWDRDDGPSREGETIEVVVRDGDALRRFVVSVAWSVDYDAREVEVRRAG